MNAKRKRKALKVYYQYQYQPLTFFLGFIMFWMASTFLCSLFFTPLALATANNTSHWIVYVIPASLTLAVTVIIGTSMHLDTHEDALEYHTLFKHVVIAWGELSYLDVEESSDSEGTTYNYFLYLKDKDSARLNIGLMVPVRHKRNSAGFLVDIDHLLTTPFGQDLYAKAPHVIEATRDKQASAEKWQAELEAQKMEYRQRNLQARTINRKERPIHTYPLLRYKPFEFLTAAIAYSVVLFFSIGLLLSFINGQLNILIQWEVIFIFTTVISIALAFWFKSHTALTVYESGLQYRITLQSNVFVAWSELTRLDVFDATTTNLYLKGSRIPAMNIEYFVPIKRHVFRVARARRLIDVAHLLSTPFGQDLQRYAPHVIEAIRNKQHSDETQ
jgi:hypothetical protein